MKIAYIHALVSKQKYMDWIEPLRYTQEESDEPIHDTDSDARIRTLLSQANVGTVAEPGMPGILGLTVFAQQDAFDPAEAGAFEDTVHGLLYLIDDTVVMMPDMNQGFIYDPETQSFEELHDKSFAIGEN